jgi:hypothetical protein
MEGGDSLSEIQGEIRYSAKELFAQINSKLDVIAETLTTKADHETLVALDVRVAHLEALENQRKGFSKAQTAIVGLLLAIAGLLVPIVVSLFLST